MRAATPSPSARPARPDGTGRGRGIRRDPSRSRGPKTRGVCSLRSNAASLAARRKVSSASSLTRRIFADERELAEVGRQHQTVPAPVACDLLAHRRSQHVFVRRLDLDHAPLRSLTRAGVPPLHLPGRVEAEIGMACALIGHLPDAEHLRLERGAHRVEQVRERPVARSLPRRTARGTHPPQIGEVRLDRCGQLRARARHHPQVVEQEGFTDPSPPTMVPLNSRREGPPPALPHRGRPACGLLAEASARRGQPRGGARVVARLGRIRLGGRRGRPPSPPRRGCCLR